MPRLLRIVRPAKPSRPTRTRQLGQVGAILATVAFAGILVTACSGKLAFSWPRGWSAQAVASVSSPSLAVSDAASPAPAVSPSPSPTPTPSPSPTPADVRQPTSAPAAGGGGGGGGGAPVAQAGASTLSIPALGLYGPVGTWTDCGGSIPNRILYYACAGHNNFYLLGHAWGVFKAVHDGYHAGTLTPGMTAVYTDASGVAHTYRLQWVKDMTVADWGNGASWAATSSPVMTLQTCDGANDEYRIIVRFSLA